MTKEEKVWGLNEAIGEDLAKVTQQNNDAEKAAHYEAWFKKEILGRRSNYKPE